METQRTIARRHPQWGTTFLAAAIVVILGPSIAKDYENASLPSHAAASSQTTLPIVQHPDIHPDHQILLSDALRALPSKCQASLRHLYVRYDRPSERGLAGKDTIILNGNAGDAELRALFIHEFGHITDLGCLRGTPEGGSSAFHDGPEQIFHNDPSFSFYTISWVRETTQKPESARDDFVSGYAAKDAFEDFAETFAYLILQPEAFKARAQENAALQKKFLWMQEHVFYDTKTIAIGNRWNGAIPWDVTKLRYTVYSSHASASRSRRTMARK